MVGHLYFHSPCFDGIAAAVIVWDFLEAKWGWEDPRLRTVDYHLRDEWLATPLEKPAAVVDFLYHPQADFWADHHGTTFLDPRLENDYQSRRAADQVYDPSARSCAELLWHHLDQRFGHRNVRYEELVRWAAKTDSADYESVEEAIMGTAAALRISRSLSVRTADDDCQELVRALREGSLEEVAELPAVKQRALRADELITRGLDRLQSAVHLDDNIVQFDVDGRDVLVNRYAPFRFFPSAPYSAGIVRTEGRAVMRAMRNPWRDFPSVHLGRIFERLGGGGHQRVGSLVLRKERASEATSLLKRIVAEIRQAETLGQGDAGR